MEFSYPGVYSVRAEDAAHFAKNTVLSWLDNQEHTPYKGLLWLTAAPQQEVMQCLQPYLSNRRSAPKGLDVLSVRSVLAKGQASNSIRALCRSFNTLTVLKPCLVVFEHAHLWFASGQESLEESNPSDQMRLLHQWAAYANARIILPLQGAHPDWSAFADGLSEVDSRGHAVFRPWWPTTWGQQSGLWHEGEQSRTASDQHWLIHSSSYPNKQALAQACHAMRFGGAFSPHIHIQAHGELTRFEASVLLRLGADSVLLDEGPTHQWLNIDQRALTDPLYTTNVGDSMQFARDLHEVFMPGRLGLLGNKDFARLGLMMQRLARDWGCTCTLTRLSLMGHVNAKTAMQLAHTGQAGAMFTATREAICMLKLWPSEPHSEQYAAWLASCFNEPLGVLFSGDILLNDVQEISGLLNDIGEELEPLKLDELVDIALQQPSDLPSVWNAQADDEQSKRPWLGRLQQWAQGKP